MNFLHQLQKDKYIFATTFLLVVLLNIAQYAFGYGLVKGIDPWSLNFGFPFSYYEHGFKVQGFGRILYVGIAGNLFFAVILGCLASFVPTLLEKSLVVKSDLFRQRTIDVPAFLTVGAVIILLNVGQYLVGYGGLGFVAQPEPSGLTLGFPFAYYHYSFESWNGEVVFLGAIGNLLFSVALGTIAGAITSRIQNH